MSFPRTLILFLHGSGGNGLEMSTFFQSVPLEHLEMNTFYQAATRLNVDIVCPTAAKRPYTAMMGQPMNVWFDRSSDFMRQGVEDTEDLAGADRSVAQILALVAEKQAEYEHIFVGGFSMGGCLALHLLRAEADGRLPRAVRGLFSMGSFLVERSAVLGAWTEGPDGGPRSTSSALPVFMMHGTADSLIQHDWGRTTATNLLLKVGAEVHSTCVSSDRAVRCCAVLLRALISTLCDPAAGPRRDLQIVPRGGPRGERGLGQIAPNDPVCRPHTFLRTHTYT